MTCEMHLRSIPGSEHSFQLLPQLLLSFSQLHVQMTQLSSTPSTRCSSHNPLAQQILSCCGGKLLACIRQVLFVMLAQQTRLTSSMQHARPTDMLSRPASCKSARNNLPEEVCSRSLKSGACRSPHTIARLLELYGRSNTIHQTAK